MKLEFNIIKINITCFLLSFNFLIQTKIDEKSLIWSSFAIIMQILSMSLSFENHICRNT